MATIPNYINQISDLSQYVNTADSSLQNNLQNLTKLLYEYGQQEKSYKKSNKKSRNLSDNLLVTQDFGTDEIWSQIKDHSQTVLSTVDQRSKSRQNERKRMQQILEQLKSDVNATNIENVSENENETENLLHNTAQFIDDSDSPNDNTEKPQTDNNNWVNFIKGQHKQSKTDSTAQEQKEPSIAQSSDEDIDYDEFQKQTDEMEAFINKQWDKEREMAEDGAFDLFNDDITDRALIFDRENKNNKNIISNAEQTKPDTNQTGNDEDFAFLNKHIAHDSDNDNDNGTQHKNDGWNDLFNLPKLKQSETENKSEMNKIENESELQSLSKFEIEERAIQQRIKKLEESNMKMRSWEYQGEVSNNKFTHPHAVRSKNSLLSTYLDFDYSDKLKPQMTDDLNMAIENMIITKIKNEQFDDIERKRDFANAPSVPKRKLVEIQDTKSSMGLAELYEREYLQQIESKQSEMNDSEMMSGKDMELCKRYEKISRLKSSLFYELDQMIRFHYEPKQSVISDNIKVKTHTNALYLEEMVPFAMTNEMTMAPEQLYRKPRKFGHIKGENEMSKSDRRNKRASNKKRAKYWKLMRGERDRLRGRYDEKFNKHLKRSQALNEVRTHAMAAVKKNGYLKGKNVMGVERDETRYTSTKQFFGKIQQHQDNKMKRKLEEEGERNETRGHGYEVPPEKKMKIKSMMH